MSAITDIHCMAINHGANTTGRRLETKSPISTLLGASSAADEICRGRLR